MQKFLKLAFVSIAFLFSSMVSAQDCVRAPQIQGRPATCWDGRQIVGTSQFPVYLPAYQQVGMVQTIPQQFVNQPFMAMVGGQRKRCSWVDRAATGALHGAVAGIGVYLGERIFKSQDHTASKIALLGGAISGATLNCDPDIYDDNDNIVAGNQQRLIAGQQTGVAQTGVLCSLGGKPAFHVASTEACVEEGKRYVVANSQGTVTVNSHSVNNWRCQLLWNGNQYNFNTVGGVKIDSAWCESYKTGARAFPPQEKMEFN